MAEEGNRVAAQGVAEADSVKETLSQFVARVLSQLSLSAWLPAASLVLLLTFVVELGAALDTGHKAPDVSPVVQAFRSVQRMSIGGALLLIVAIVVLTMVTQAFSFDTIQLLEGYWGTIRWVEWIAEWRCDRHRRTQVRLSLRSRSLLEDAWAGAQRELQGINEEMIRKGRPAARSPGVIEAIGAAVLGVPRSAPLTEAERKVYSASVRDWRQWAPPSPLRRRTNLEKRLQRFPAANRVQPTRLGNILRRYEDITGVPDVKAFIQREFENLPPSIRAEHDEQRIRLDLYCSMVFVVLLTTAIGVLRFAVYHIQYAIAAAVVGLLAAHVMYRAAIASAEAYGGLLVVAARYLSSNQPKRAARRTTKSSAPAS